MNQFNSHQSRPRLPAAARPNAAAQCTLAVAGAMLWWNQATGAPADTVTTVEVRGNGADLPDERLSATTAKVVIRREDMERYSDGNALDVLGRVPGLTVDRSRSRGAEIQMRGLGGGYTQILINGQPAPNGFSLDTLSTGLIERIEVLRSATADTGAQSVAGTINIVLKSAGLRTRRELKHTAANEQGGHTLSISGQYAGDIGEGNSFLLAPSLSHETFERPATLHDHSSGPGAMRAVTERASDNRMDTLNLLSNARRKFNDGGTLTADATLTMRHIAGNSDDRVDLEAGPVPEFMANRVDYRVASKLIQGNLKWATPWGEHGRLQAEAGLRLGHRTTGTGFNGYDELARLAVRRDVAARADDRELTSNGRYTATLSNRQTLTFGWQGGISRRGESRLQHDETPTGRQPFNLDESYDADVRRLALFAQDEITIAPRWSAYLSQLADSIACFKPLLRRPVGHQFAIRKHALKSVIGNRCGNLVTAFVQRTGADYTPQVIVPILFFKICCGSIEARLPGFDLPPQRVVFEVGDDHLLVKAPAVTAYDASHPIQEFLSGTVIRLAPLKISLMRTSAPPVGQSPVHALK